MRRAGLDYHEYASLRVYADWDAFVAQAQPELARTFVMTTRGAQPFATQTFAPGDWFVFGSESKGLSDAVRERLAAATAIRLPMQPGNRSLNLSNAAAVVVFEAWRQQGFAGGV